MMTFTFGQNVPEFAYRLAEKSFCKISSLKTSKKKKT